MPYYKIIYGNGAMIDLIEAESEEEAFFAYVKGMLEKSMIRIVESSENEMELLTRYLKTGEI